MKFVRLEAEDKLTRLQQLTAKNLLGAVVKAVPQSEDEAEKIKAYYSFIFGCLRKKENPRTLFKIIEEDVRKRLL